MKSLIKSKPNSERKTQVWSVVQTSAAESFIPKLKTLNDVKFNKDTEEQVMADLCMKRERHRAMKMAIPMEEIMTFVSEFFGPEGEGLPEKHVSQLKTVAKHSLKSAIQENTFTVTNNQLELSSYFVAFKKHGKK